MRRLTTRLTNCGANLNTNTNQSEIKRLNLLGGIGAGVLGGGLALLFSEWLKPFTIPALVLGIVAHGWAMFQKSRLEQLDGIASPRWAEIAERVCWLTLAGLVLYIGFRVLL